MERLPRTVWLGEDEADGALCLYLIDQTRLPLVGDVLACRTLEAARLAIQTLAVRGAPAIGVAAAMALAVWAHNESEHADAPAFLSDLREACDRLASARPTAVNLKWATERFYDYACILLESDGEGGGMQVARRALRSFAEDMAATDERTNRAIGAHGATLLEEGSRILTLCNAGSLATAFFGTALGVVYAAFEQGRVAQVWACETRPLNQGARLTMWELMCCGIPATLVAEGMAATLMAQGLVDCVLVGADRICANGDAANKIGTLGLAVLAKHYGVPFYVAAPKSSIDPAAPDGAAVPIEQRDPQELCGFFASGILLPSDEQEAKALDALTDQGERSLSFKHGHRMSIARKGGAYGLDAWFRTTPPGAAAYNPAFDVTPAGLISAIVTEDGICRPPYAFSSVCQKPARPSS
jgi:methylthioribose-1-phosphate isomerase